MSGMWHPGSVERGDGYLSVPDALDTPGIS